MFTQNKKITAAILGFILCVSLALQPLSYALPDDVSIQIKYENTATSVGTIDVAPTGTSVDMDIFLSVNTFPSSSYVFTFPSVPIPGFELTGVTVDNTYPGCENPGGTLTSHANNFVYDSNFSAIDCAKLVAHFTTNGATSGSHTIQSSLSDAGNPAVAFSVNNNAPITLSVADAVILTSAETRDNDHDGRIDGAKLYFNQSFDQSAFDVANLSFSGRTGIAVTGGTGNELDVSFDPIGSGYDTDSVPFANITTDYTNSGVTFGSGGVTPLDKAGPTLVGGSSGAILRATDSLQMIFSESMHSNYIGSGVTVQDAGLSTIPGIFSNISTTEWSFLPIGGSWPADGTYTVTFSSGAFDLSNNEMIPWSFSFTASGSDTTPPVGEPISDTFGSGTGVLIDHGKAYTTNPDGNVLLIFSGSDDSGIVSKMCISSDILLEDANCPTGSGWVDYANSNNPFPLGGIEGIKTVYVKFKDGADNFSPVYSDTIIWDKTPPTSTFSINGGSFTGATESSSFGTGGLDLVLLADSDTTDIHYTLYLDSGSTVIGTGSFTGSGEILDFSGKIVFYAQDVAAQELYSHTIIHEVDLAGPTGGTVTIDNGASYVGTGVVSVSAPGAIDPHGPILWRAFESGGDTTAWLPLASSGQISLSTGDGEKTVTAEFKDGLENISSTVTDTIYLDTTGPIINATGTVTPNYSAATIAGVSVSDGSGAGIASVELSYSGMTDSLTGTASLSLSGGTWEGSIPNLGSDTTYAYSLIVTDLLGNVTEQAVGTFQTLYDWQAQYVSIGNALTASGIVNNFTGVTNSNVTNYQNLYFEKTGYGKILFSSDLDLTNSGTMLFLQNLPSKLDMSEGRINFDPTGSDFANYGAQLYMYFDTGSTFVTGINDPSQFIIRSSTGVLIDGSSVLSNILGACGVGDPYCTLFFDTSHFTSFDLKPFLTSVHVESDNAHSGALARLGDTVTFSFSGSESLTGVTVTMSGVNNDAPMTLSGNGDSWSANGTVTSTGNLTPTFTIQFSDLSGNAGDTVVATMDGSSVEIDNTIPTASVEYSDTGATNSDVIATLTGASRPITVTNNSGLLTYTFTANGSFTFLFVDDLGNPGSAIATVSNIDKTAPTASVEYSTTGATNGDVIATLTGASESITGTLTYTFTGNTDYTFIFHDLVGNTGSTLASVSNIDKTPPTGEITSHASGAYLRGTVTLTATGTDIGGSGVAKVEFYYYSIGTKIGEDTTAPYSIDWNTVGIVGGDGNHTILVRVSDNAGNTYTSTGVSVIVDNIAPTITLEGSGTVSVAQNASYTDSGATWSDSIDGTGSLVASGSVDTATLGTYTLTYTKTDTTGNIATPVTRTVQVVDMTAPTLSGLTSTGITSSSGSFSVTSSESGTGYYVVVLSGSTAPSAAQILGGVDGDGNAATKTGSLTTASGSSSFIITGLSSSTAYDVYFTARDTSGNLQNTPLTVSIQTLVATDSTPDAFSFTPKTSAEKSTGYTASMTVGGIDTGSTISITGGEYAIGTGSYTTATGTVYNGDIIMVRGISSASYSTSTLVILTIGGVSGTYTITTKSAPSSGGGGGSPYIPPVKDSCPNGDFSSSLYDGNCGTSTTASGATNSGSVTPDTQVNPWIPANLSPLVARFVTRYQDPIRGISLLRTNDTSITVRMQIVELRVLNKLNTLIAENRITSEEYMQAIAGYNKFVLYLTVYRQTGNPLAKARALEGYEIFIRIYRR